MNRILRARTHAAPAAHPPPKPLLRGWLHAVAALGALATTIGLLVPTTDDPPRFVSLLVFGASMIILYTVSAIYHIGAWQGRWHTLLRSLDHANIFLFIAGTYTPIGVVLLTGWVRTTMLATIWGLAVLGMACAILTLSIPRWTLALLYSGLGWLSLILLPLIARTISLQPVLLLLGGGALYTVGAVIYALRWPNPFPRVFGFHELFHLFVVAGTVATAVMIWVWVVPFGRQ